MLQGLYLDAFRVGLAILCLGVSVQDLGVRVTV